MLLILLIFISIIFSNAQLSILNDFNTCRDFALYGTGIRKDVVIPSILVLKPIFFPGIFHAGFLVHTDAERATEVARIGRYTSVPFLPAITTYDTTVKYCGINTSLNLTAQITPSVQGFYEISQVNDLNTVNFYSDWYKVKNGSSFLYLALNTVTPCSLVKTYFQAMDMPIFQELTVVAGISYSYFVRDPNTILEVVCGV